MAAQTARQKLEAKLKKLEVAFEAEQSDEELKALLEAAEAASGSEGEGEEVEVLRSPYARLTKTGEVFKLYNAAGQLLQTGDKKLQKTFGEFTAHNKSHNLNVRTA